MIDKSGTRSILTEPNASRTVLTVPKISDENLSAVPGTMAAMNQWPELRFLSWVETKQIQGYD
jgi:hypothetical protein